MKYILLFIVVLFVNVAFAQTVKKHTLIFQPLFGSAPVQLNDSVYYRHNQDSFHISTFKFYISSLELLSKEVVVWKEKNSFHLVDASNNRSLIIAFQTQSTLVFDQIKFNLGIDSVSNVSGVMGSDLDPTKGMYWTWQSGYVNFKLEGNSNRCKTRNHEFQFHLGGYQYPFSALKSIHLNIKETRPITIQIDAMKFLEAIDIEKHNHIMSPSNEAVLLSEKMAHTFSIQE